MSLITGHGQRITITNVSENLQVGTLDAQLGPALANISAALSNNGPVPLSDMQTLYTQLQTFASQKSQNPQVQSMINQFNALVQSLGGATLVTGNGTPLLISQNNNLNPLTLATYISNPSANVTIGGLMWQFPISTGIFGSVGVNVPAATLNELLNIF